MSTLEQKIKKMMIWGGIAASSLFWGCNSDSSYWTSDSYDTDPNPVTHTREETNKNIFMDEGVVVPSWWFNDYSRPVTDETLERMWDDGVESITFLTTWYQDDANSTEIYRVSTKTPSDDALRHAIQKAKSLGMKVVLKPHVDPWDGDWRGYIEHTNESDWTDWFDSYNDFITYYARFAEENEVDTFIVGTELAKTVHRPEWYSVISNVNFEFPSGETIYGANHDNYMNVPFWDEVDYIGISAYFSLTNFNDPTQTELDDAWTNIAQQLKAFSESNGNKPIVITEIGYQSYDGTNKTPWWTSSMIVDEEEQRGCYEAAFKALFNQPWVKGMYFWMCYYDPWQDVNGFDFVGKPAENEVFHYYHLED